MRSVAFLLSTLLLAASSSAAVRWDVQVDSRTTAQWLAESAGAVYGLRDGHPIAFDVRDGRIRWSDAGVTALGAPAFTQGVVAFPVHDGVVWFDASSGRVLRRTSLAVTPQLVGSSSRIVAVLGDGRRLRANVVAFDHNGVLRWSRHLAFFIADAIALRRNAVAIFGVGAQHGTLIVDADTGRDVAYATHVNDLVGDDGRYVWFTVDLGGIKGLDLDTDRSLVFHGAVIPKAVTVEHGVAVAVIDGRLRRIDLSGGGSVTPLHVDGRWIGGPVAGKLFVERGDGLYLQSIDGTSRARKVASYHAESRVVASDRAIGYVGLRDGRLFVVDVARETVVATYRTGCDFYEGFTASGDTAIVHCDAKQVSHLIGFARAR